MNKQPNGISIILSQVESMTSLPDGNNKFILGSQEWIVKPDSNAGYDLEGDIWALAITTLLAEVQTVETYQGYIMVTYGDELSPSYSIFKDGEEVEGGNLDMQMLDLKAFVRSRVDSSPVEADLALIGITL